MCCDVWDLEEDWGVKANGECPDCGESTYNGEAVVRCRASPVYCKTCGSQPCDESC